MSLPKLPPSGGTMTVTYGVDRRVKVPMWDEDAMRTYAAAAVRAEREACAQVCDDNADCCHPGSVLHSVLGANAAAIRARGQA